MWLSRRMQSSLTATTATSHRDIDADIQQQQSVWITSSNWPKKMTLPLIGVYCFSAARRWCQTSRAFVHFVPTRPVDAGQLRVAEWQCNAQLPGPPGMEFGWQDVRAAVVSGCALGESQHWHAQLKLQHDIFQQLQVADNASECHPFSLGLVHFRRHSWHSRHPTPCQHRLLPCTYSISSTTWPCRCDWWVGRLDTYNVHHAASAGWLQLRCAAKAVIHGVTLSAVNVTAVQFYRRYMKSRLLLISKPYDNAGDAVCELPFCGRPSGKLLWTQCDRCECWVHNICAALSPSECVTQNNFLCSLC